MNHIGLYLADTKAWRENIAEKLGIPISGTYALGKKSIRLLSRCQIQGSGRQPLLLSVALTHEDKPQLSAHGRWQNAHKNALNTLFGRTPFSIHLLPLLMPLYEIPLPAPLEDFFDKGEEILKKWMDLDNSLTAALKCKTDSPERYKALSEEWRPRLNDDLWIGEALLTYGPQSIWGLLPLYETFPGSDSL